MQITGDTFTEIGAFDAKTRFSDLLRRVKKGERFTVTVRGQGVADLVPTQARNQRAIDLAVDRLINFPRIEGISGDVVLNWIRDGR